MKAVSFDQHGDLNNLKYGDCPNPEISDNEVLVQVHAAGLNHLDLWVLNGFPGLSLSFPHIPGADGAGVIVDTGKEVAGWQAGDQVVLDPGLSCGRCRFCRQGEESLCKAFVLLGEHVNGTFSELVKVPHTNLHAKPPHLSFEEAAAFPLTYVTAFRMLMTRAGLKQGDTVLIHGIGGGVALAALQLSKSVGARVLVTSSSDQKLQQALGLGADAGINYREERVTSAVKEFTSGEGVDVVIETAGDATWLDSIKTVRKGGTVVTCGATTGPNPRTDIRLIFWKQINILGSTMGSHADFCNMLNLVTEKKLTPVIDKHYPLPEVYHGYQRMKDTLQFGKIIFTID